MHLRLRYLSFATTTLLLSPTSPRLPLGRVEPLSVQAQTPQDRNAASEASPLAQRDVIPSKEKGDRIFQEFG